MIASISNQNFGWSVSSYDVWAAVGNPDPFRYSYINQVLRTGSVEVFKYNINTDEHDLISIVTRPLLSTEQILLSTEASNSFSIGPDGPTGPDYYLHTEYTGSIPYTADKDLLIDAGNYNFSIEDGYGFSVDIKDTILAIGNPYFTNLFVFENQNIYISGSGYVDLFDLSILAIDPYATLYPPIIINSGSLNGHEYVNVNVPPNQNYSAVILQTKPSGSPDSEYENIVSGVTSNSGGIINLQTGFPSFIGLDVRVIGIVGTNAYLTSIFPPNTGSSELILTASFGYSISLNDEWLAVGSPYESGSTGNVYMYRMVDNNVLSWSFVQTLPVPSNINNGDNFGFDVRLNKATSSFSWSLVVGSLKATSSNAYVYQFDGTEWNNTFTLYPDSSSVYPVPFYSTVPIVNNYPNTSDLFGKSVSIYGTSIMVGAPTDRIIQEYSSSAQYRQGAVYFFEQCSNANYGYYLARKSYGNEIIMNNNFLGWSVSIYGNYAVAGIPKIDFMSSSVCYLRGSLFQENYCDNDIETTLCGQYALYNKATGSIPDTTDVDWDITNIYQIKKQILSPYRVMGYDSSVSQQFIVVGSPMLMTSGSTVMDLDAFTGSFTGNVYDLDDLCGKSYIYNLKNLRENFYVGNVFYRNGKIIIMTSGSNFEGLQLNDVSTNSYEYDLSFTSKQTVYEKQIVCPVEPGEFNVSTNPTAVVLPSSSFDINKNGQFDFQDTDILLRYMAYKNTQAGGNPITDWTSSIIDTSTNEEITIYNMYSSSWQGTDNLFSSSFTYIDNSLYSSLDFTNDNRINYNDMFILWKYFIYRLTQKNYESYLSPNSQLKYLSGILDYLDGETLRGHPPVINQNFLDYPTLSQADPTGSYLAPYATSIGLYSGTELVAIAKLGSPIKITPDFPINFVVKIDF